MLELRNQGLPAGGQNLLSRVGSLLGIGASGSDERFASVGYNFKSTNVLGALALGQLSQLTFRMERIRQTYKIYKEKIKPLLESPVLSEGISKPVKISDRLQFICYHA